MDDPNDSGPSATEGQLTVLNSPAAARYEARIGSELAGFAAYRMHKGRVVFTHTEVDPAFEGKGVGSALARSALDDVRERGLRAIALCPFVSAYIRRHPEYDDLVADDPPTP